MKILLLEDESLLNDSITQYLKRLGHVVESFKDGLKAYEAIDTTFDLLLLDINVPNISGFELIEKLNELNVHIPTIFISALIDISDITKGYELGCIEYMKKPFHLQELGIKLNQLLKNEVRTQNHILLSKNYSFAKDSRTLYFQNEPQNLTKKQIDIIELLALNINMVVDFEKFRMDVWENEPIDNPTIRAEISRLNKTLKEDFIKNIRGLGYKIDRYYSKLVLGFE
ncbi:MAG: response regulator transcription factor [Campylobacterales bacterium]|nr:response regulator transcription factor [Campylobacterales bacterium]